MLFYSNVLVSAAGLGVALLIYTHALYRRTGGFNLKLAYKILRGVDEDIVNQKA